MNKIYDLYNKEVKVGDRVVIGRDTNVDSCYLVCGKVTDISYKKIRTTLTIEVDRQGQWNNGSENKAPKWDKIISYRIPREHTNIVIL